jgi:mannitol/fructose-specific phosphotransferase system IIA component (Ntr-type)
MSERAGRPLSAAACFRPVDLVFLLLLPAEQLRALASVARKLRDAASLRSLRAAAGTAELYAAMIA